MIGLGEVFLNKDISIIELLKLLLKKWWIVVVVSIALGGLAFGYTKYYVSPTYLSRGMLYVTNTNVLNYEEIDILANRNLNLGDLVASQTLATTYIEILNSDSFMRTVSTNSGIYESPSKLRSMISISAKNNTEILEVRVVNTNPKSAFLIAETFLENSKDELTRVFKGGSVEIIDNAVTPTLPIGPDIIRNTLLGIMFGVVAGCVIVFLTDLFDGRVKNQEDLVAKHNIPVLGLIPSLQCSKKLLYSNYKETSF